MPIPNPASWPVRPDCVIGGFLAPMERAALDACLAAEIPVVWLQARGMPEYFPPRLRRAMDNGRLLAMTPFAPAVTAISAARAVWCNDYALHLATNAVIGHLNPDGMLACLLMDLRRAIPVHILPPPTPPAPS